MFVGLLRVPDPTWLTLADTLNPIAFQRLSHSAAHELGLAFLAGEGPARL